MAVLDSSPARAAGGGDSSLIGTTDQRGVVRSNHGITIGAYQEEPILVNTTHDTASGAEAFGDMSLRDAINIANIDGGLYHNIRFDPALAGSTIAG